MWKMQENYRKKRPLEKPSTNSTSNYLGTFEKKHWRKWIWEMMIIMWYISGLKTNVNKIEF